MWVIFFQVAVTQFVPYKIWTQVCPVFCCELRACISD